MQVTFTAHIKKIENKSLVSGDSGVRLTIDKDNMDVGTFNAINEIKSHVNNQSGEIKVTLSES